MKKKKNFLGMYILASAIIWGATIIGCALKLKENYTEISNILILGAAMHLILIWGPIAAKIKKANAQT